MKKIDIFYQGHGIKEIEHLELADDETFSSLKSHIAKKHGLEGELLIFLEESDDPIEGIILIREHAGSCGVKVHVHRCRHVKVAVTFNGETVHREFAPGATVARIKRWAAEHEFKMSPEDAGEHLLQIKGTTERPAPSTHIGTLAKCPKCDVSFNLVPDERVNGASDEVSDERT